VQERHGWEDCFRQRYTYRREYCGGTTQQMTRDGAGHLQYQRNLERSGRRCKCTISSTGLYTPTTVPAPAQVSVTATHTKTRRIGIGNLDDNDDGRAVKYSVLVSPGAPV